MTNPASPDCPDLATLDGFVAAGASDSMIDAHVRTCVACARQVERIGKNEALLDELGPIAGIPTPGFTAGPNEIEGYDVEAELYRGGQGIVHRAVHRATGRTVALKVLLRGALATSRQRRRFEREVELVARLEHPNIVSILDSGVHEARYFYAMEFVDGRSLDHAIDAGHCEIRSALEMVAAIADAVNYAHQRGVLHRDLKPANIIVDERGEPRLVDFGLGKAIDDTATGRDQRTISEPGALLGTLGYMAPEQALGQVGEVSVASDVYAIGVIAYEMITGHLPCPITGPLNEVLDRIAHQEPPAPSTIRRRVDPDVDAILLKTLEKSARDRYATAGQLAADIRRSLANETITARRASFATRTRRWVRRNRRVAVVAGVAMALLVIVTATSFVRIRRERDLARIAEQTATVESRQARQAATFLVELFGLFGSARSGAATEVTVDDVLRHGASQVRQLEDPLTRARILDVIGGVHKGRGDYDAATPILAEALALRRRHLGLDDVEVAHSMNLLGGARHASGDFDEASRLYTDALEIFRRHLGPHHREVGVTISNLANLAHHAWADHAAAERGYRAALDIYERWHAGGHRETAGARQQLGHLLLTVGRLEEAEREFALARSTLAEIGAGDELGFADVSVSHAWLALTNGEMDTAAREFREATAIYERQLGPDHLKVAEALNGLAVVLVNEETVTEAEAEAVCRRALDIRVATYGLRHRDVAQTRNTLAYALWRSGRRDEGETLCRAALATRREVLAAGHPEIAVSLLTLAEMLQAEGRYDEAVEAAREGLAIRRHETPPDPVDVATAHLTLGEILRRRGDPDAAEPHLHECLRLRRERWPEDHPKIVEARTAVAALSM